VRFKDVVQTVMWNWSLFVVVGAPVAYWQLQLEARQLPRRPAQVWRWTLELVTGKTTSLETLDTMDLAR